MSGLVAQEALPGEATSLTAAIQPLQQQSVDCPFKAVKCPTVIGDSKVIEVSPQLGVLCITPRKGIFQNEICESHAKKALYSFSLLKQE